MYLELVSSLKDISIVKVSTIIWNCTNHRRLEFYVKKAYNRRCNHLKIWNKIQAKLKATVLKINVPENLKSDILNYLKPTGMEILMWSEYHCLVSYLDLDLPKKFYWTSQGTIDYEKTAKALIMDDDVCLTARYKLACIYCLEDDISELWNKMSSQCRAIFYNTGQYERLMEQHPLVTFWTYHIHGKRVAINKRVGETNSVVQLAFEYAATSGNVVATKYFFKKLTPEEKEKSLLMTAKKLLPKSQNDLHSNPYHFPSAYYNRVLIFLISHAEIEQKILFINEHAVDILYYMDWPYQRFFMETVNLLDEYISAPHLSNFLADFAHMLFKGHSYYDYSGLITEIWLKSPQTHRNYVINNDLLMVLQFILKSNDEKNARLILNELDPEKKREFFFTEATQYAAYSLLNRSSTWDALKLFIELCIPKKEDVIKFRDDFWRKKVMEDDKGKYARFFDMLLPKQKRKCVKENGGNLPKKHR